MVRSSSSSSARLKVFSVVMGCCNMSLVLLEKNYNNNLPYGRETSQVTMSRMRTHPISTHLP